MEIYLGNLSVEQMEKRTGITLSDDDREFMKSNRQENVSVPLEEGKWHCYDIPLMLMTRDIKTAIVYRNMLTKYDWSSCREALQIGYGKEEKND